MRKNWFIRLAGAALALTLGCTSCFAGAMGEGTDMADHFVPANPDQMPAVGEELVIDLATRESVFGQRTGEDMADGVRYAGGDISKCMFPMNVTVEKDQCVSVTITGRFDSAEDAAIRLYLTNSEMENRSNNVVTIANPGAEVFTQTVDLIADRSADRVMLASASFADYLQDFTLISLTVDSAVTNVQQLQTSVSYEDAVQQPWYQDLLKNAQVRLGNNKRLKRVIERAQAGEHITIATIGGSITEGAGAAKYKECYAYQIFDGFRKTYGVGDGSNVSMVNAGVGGTPSTFGWMRYEREVVGRVRDDDDLPDIVVIEYAVNDGGEPTRHQCYESMVKSILEQPNEPVVILLFSVFPTGYTLQKELVPIGRAYDLMMVSMADSAFPYVGVKWTKDDFFYDEYHPTTMGHKVMADCVLGAIAAAAALPENETDINLDVKPVYGTRYMGMQRIFRDSIDESLNLEIGSFREDDQNAYKNQPVGRVCGKNFYHSTACGDEPMTFTATFKNFMIAYRTVSDASFGHIEVFIDGSRVGLLNANTGSWGQSVVDLLYSSNESAEHEVMIRMYKGDEKKKFTITCMSFTP